VNSYQTRLVFVAVDCFFLFSGFYVSISLSGEVKSEKRQPRAGQKGTEATVAPFCSHSFNFSDGFGSEMKSFSFFSFSFLVRKSFDS
jgi:hypothetical protein